MVLSREEWNKVVDVEEFIEKKSLGFKWKLSTTYQSCIDRHIIKGWKWEESTTNAIEKLVSEGQTVVDIGANIGYFTLFLSKFVGDSGRVIAFEPFPYFHNRLMYHLDINGIKNVTVVKKGLYNESCRKLMDRGFPSATIVDKIDKNRDYNYSKYDYGNFITLDGWCDENKIENIDFIKIDTDGSEVKILKGGRKIIDRCKPAFLCEFYKDIEKLGELFKCFGHDIYHINFNKIGKRTLQKIIRSKRGKNLLCLHGYNE